MSAESSNQDDLERLRKDQSGKCWWCGGLADSREHKHKASLLRRMWGEEGLYLGRDGQDLWSVPSAKSEAVKFSKTLCRECNNVRSQPFDEAYDTFAKYIWANGRELSRARQVDWVHVYGADWEKQARNLGRYVVKSSGCWIADSGFPPPPVFAQFLNGGQLVDTGLMLMRQQSMSLAYLAIRLGGAFDFDRGIGVLDSKGWLDPGHTSLAGYEHISYISDICIRIAWHSEEGHGPVFWDDQFTPLTVMPAMMSQRLLALKIAFTALGRRAASVYGTRFN